MWIIHLFATSSSGISQLTPPFKLDNSFEIIELQRRAAKNLAGIVFLFCNKYHCHFSKLIDFGNFPESITESNLIHLFGESFLEFQRKISEWTQATHAFTLTHTATLNTVHTVPFGSVWCRQSERLFRLFYVCIREKHSNVLRALNEQLLVLLCTFSLENFLHNIIWRKLICLDHYIDCSLSPPTVLAIIIVSVSSCRAFL